MFYFFVFLYFFYNLVWLQLRKGTLTFDLITVSMIYFFEGDFFLLLMKFQFHAEISISWALSSVTIKLILQYQFLSDM